VNIDRNKTAQYIKGDEIVNREQKRARDGKFAPDLRGKKSPSRQSITSPEVNSVSLKAGTKTSPKLRETHAAYRRTLPLVHMSGIECHYCGKEYPSREWDGHNLPDEEGYLQDYCDQCVSDCYDEEKGYFPSS